MIKLKKQDVESNKVIFVTKKKVCGWTHSGKNLKEVYRTVTPVSLWELRFKGEW